MADYKVRLDVFEGPLDLLLYLVRKEEVDIYNIPIANITSQYMEYLGLIKMLVPDVAGEFVVMGATLMYIKSRMLLPEDQQVSDPEAAADELDPRWDLIRQLVEYKKFKEAAEHLQKREHFQENVYPRQAGAPGLEPSAVQDPGLGDSSIFDLLNAFNQALKRFDADQELRGITEDRYTVSGQIECILRMTAAEEHFSFSRLFEGAASRVEVVVTFLALLELIRLRRVRAEQGEAFGEIRIVRLKQEPASSINEAPPDPKDHGTEVPR